MELKSKANYKEIEKSINQRISEISDLHKKNAEEIKSAEKNVSRGEELLAKAVSGNISDFVSAKKRVMDDKEILDAIKDRASILIDNERIKTDYLKKIQRQINEEQTGTARAGVKQIYEALLEVKKLCDELKAEIIRGNNLYSKVYSVYEKDAPAQEKTSLPESIRSYIYKPSIGMNPAEACLYHIENLIRKFEIAPLGTFMKG